MEKERKFLHGFIKYTPNGTIVPGSLIITPNRPHPGIWEEVVIDLCCDDFGPNTNNGQRAFVKFSTDGKIVPGSLVMGKHIPKPGIWKEVSVNLCCDITPITTTSTTTTTTAAPTGWYLRNSILSPNNGDITFPDFVLYIPTFNANHLGDGGNGDIYLVMNIHDINGNTVPNLTELVGNNGQITLTQGSNSVIYDFDYTVFYSDGTQISGWPYLTTPAAVGDFNLIDHIDISTNIYYTTTTTTTAAPIPSVSICAVNWTSVNLNVTTYKNGDPILLATTAGEWEAADIAHIGAWCHFNNDPANDALYGKLYNGWAVTDPRGLAPLGYHIPTSVEWATVETCLGGIYLAGGPMKEAGLTHWSSPNTGATNASGFTGLPGGYRYQLGSFFNLGYGYWWHASGSAACALRNDTETLSTAAFSTGSGMGIRLIKD